MNNKKGFTFEQVAVLMLVIMGLVVAVILASTQLKKGAGSLAKIGEQSTAGTDVAVESAKGLACQTAGGECKLGIDDETTGETLNPCDATSLEKHDCGDNKYCCIP